MGQLEQKSLVVVNETQDYMTVNPALPFFSREKVQGNEEERKNRNKLILQGDKQLKGNKPAVISSE